LQGGKGLKMCTNTATHEPVACPEFVYAVQ